MSDNMQINLKKVAAVSTNATVETAAKLIKESQEWTEELSDETKYEIEIEDFNKETQKVLDETEEKMKKLQEEIDALEKKASAGDLSEEEMKELDGKKRELMQLQVQFKTDTKSRQSEAKIKTDKIVKNLEAAGETGTKTLTAGLSLTMQANSKKKANKMLFHVIGSAATSIGKKLVDLVNQMFQKLSTSGKTDKKISASLTKEIKVTAATPSK